MVGNVCRYKAIICYPTKINIEGLSVMKGVVKFLLGKTSLGRKFLESRRQKRILARFGAKDNQELFTHYFHSGLWESEESASGPGSTVEYTENIRKEIPALIDKLEVKTILDVPCGDFNWFQLLERDESIHYVGGDIVEPLIKHNEEKYGNENTKFACIDILRDDLPQADLWLCRDCLFHLSNDDIFKAINKFLNSDIKYLLTSTHPNCKENTDIATGQFRELNLELPPFNFGKPITVMDDWIEGFPVRYLGLWEREQLNKQFLSKNR